MGGVGSAGSGFGVGADGFAEDDGTRPPSIRSLRFLLPAIVLPKLGLRGVRNVMSRASVVATVTWCPSAAC